MTANQSQTYTAFDSDHLLAQGPLGEVVIQVKRRIKAAPDARILVFSDSTGKQMDFDLSGSESDVLGRLQVYLSPASEPTATPGPGRPKLGVVAREVSLLPRHWEWLSTQSGGASATLRRLVEGATRDVSGREQVRQAQERTHKLMSALAGDQPGYEEALRALYARDKRGFTDQTRAWPRDIKRYASELAEDCFG